MYGFTGKNRFCMAGYAESGACRLKHIFVIRLMRVVTIQTFALGNREVRECPVQLDFFVTDVTEFPTCCFQLKPAVTLVRIMTIIAITCGDRWVNILFGVFALMAFVAQTRFTFVRQQECFFFELGMAFICRLMA